MGYIQSLSEMISTPACSFENIISQQNSIAVGPDPQPILAAPHLAHCSRRLLADHITYDRIDRALQPARAVSAAGEIPRSNAERIRLLGLVLAGLEIFDPLNCFRMHFRLQIVLRLPADAHSFLYLSVVVASTLHGLEPVIMNDFTFSTLLSRVAARRRHIKSQTASPARFRR